MKRYEWFDILVAYFWASVALGCSWWLASWGLGREIFPGPFTFWRVAVFLGAVVIVWALVRQWRGIRS